MKAVGGLKQSLNLFGKIKTFSKQIWLLALIFLFIDIL